MIDRTILQCLDPDPEHRPDSVDDIMRQLPGYDPLAAAVAAGETPSPAMVAAAETAPELSAIAAWALLLFVIGGMAAFVLPTGRTMFYRRFDLKPPEVLLDRARQAVTAAGVSTRGDWSTIYDARRCILFIARVPSRCARAAPIGVWCRTILP